MLYRRLRSRFQVVALHESLPAVRPGSTAGCQPAGLHLRLVATSDVHGHLRGYDYYADRPAGGGLARLATLATELREAADVSLLLDNGDFLQGTPLVEPAAACSRGPNPAIAAMNAMGYDAVSLGNHEFDHGAGPLRAALAEARFPVVCANLLQRRGAHPGLDAPLVAPWVILERFVPGGMLRIGLLGLAPPQTAAWAGGAADSGLTSRGIAETAAARVPEIRTAGADLVVVLCHSGIGSGRENAALALGRVPGLDAIVAGHTHLVFPGPRRTRRPGMDARAGTLHGVPAVEAGAQAQRIGVIDLQLARGPGGWRVTSDATATHAVPREVPEAPSVLAATEAAHRRTCARLRSPLGRTRQPLQSYFAQIGPSAPLALLAEAMRSHARARLPACHGDLPLLVAVSPGRSGGRGGPDNYLDIPPGPLMSRHAAEIFGFADPVCAIPVTGAELSDWLERSAAHFRRIRPGARGQRLLDPEAPGFYFDVIDGLSYSIDVSRPRRYDADGTLVSRRARRVGDLRHAGQPVRAGDRFVLVTNGFRMGGGGSFAPVAGKTDLIAGGPVREALETHLGAMSCPQCPSESWGFAPLSAPTEVIFETGPGARAHLDAAPRQVTEQGVSADGFLRLALTL